MVEDSEEFDGAAGHEADVEESDGVNGSSDSPEDFQDLSGNADGLSEPSSLAALAAEHRIPVNELREANKDVVDDQGRVTGQLKLPE